MARGRNGGGLGGMLLTGVIILVVAAGAFAFAKVNNITSIGDVVSWAKYKSGQVNSCLADHPSVDGKPWECDFDAKKAVTGADKGATKQTEVPQEAQETPEKPDLKDVRAKAEKLSTSQASDAQYAARDFPHWVGAPCDTRSQVLSDRGQDVKTDDDDCKVTSGTFKDAYTGDSLDEVSKANLTYVISPAYAVAHGADAWDEAKRTSFANDAQNIVITSRDTAEKVKKDAAENLTGYEPKEESARCDYAANVVRVADKYGLSVSEADKKALVQKLAQCS